MVNSKTRVNIALENHTPDRVPILEYIDNMSVINLASMFNGISTSTTEGQFNGDPEANGNIMDVYCKVVDKIGLDATWIGFSIGLEKISKKCVRDKYGRVFQLSPHGEPVPKQGPVQQPDDLKVLNLKEKVEYEDFDFPRYVARELPGLAHFLNIPDPFKEAWRLRGGMESFLKDLIKQPSFAHDLLRLTVNYLLHVIDHALEVTPEIHFIMDGDLAQEKSTIISPSHYREFIKPLHKEIVEYVHQLGAKIIKHTDGDAWPIIDDFVEVGFDGFHPVQPQCMDIREVKRHLEGKMCIIGNIDCRELLPNGNKAKVIQSVRETLDAAAPGGGYILSSSNSIHPGVDPQNYLTMVNTAREYGRYG